MVFTFQVACQNKFLTLLFNFHQRIKAFKMKNTIIVFLLIFSTKLFAQTEKFYQINGVERKALFFEPKINSEKIPVVFVFHGHGGNAKHASRNLNFHQNFPEALVIYMQGIPGVTNSIVDKEGKYNGWQMNPDELQNRDVKFFDEVFSQISKNYNLDFDRIYAVGHSNGSRFVNVLWKIRPEKFAAFVSVAGPGGIWLKSAPQKSVWISFGKNDKIVPYKIQKFSSKQYLKFFEANESTAQTNGEITSYQTSENKEIIIEDRNAGHEFPQNSIPKMVEFLKRNHR